MMRKVANGRVVIVTMAMTLLLMLASCGRRNSMYTISVINRTTLAFNNFDVLYGDRLVARPGYLGSSVEKSEGPQQIPIPEYVTLKWDDTYGGHCLKVAAKALAPAGLKGPFVVYFVVKSETNVVVRFARQDDISGRMQAVHE